jgi:hypothetical protein
VAGLESLPPNLELSNPVAPWISRSKIYDGLMYLADASRNLQSLRSHNHIELEVNLLVQGTSTYVVDGLHFSFSPRTLPWLCSTEQAKESARQCDHEIPNIRKCKRWPVLQQASSAANPMLPWLLSSPSFYRAAFRRHNPASDRSGTSPARSRRVVCA